MATDIVNDGAANNDGNGDTLRAAFTAINLVLQKADATSCGEVRLFEDTDNGSNYVAVKSTAAVTANRAFVLPDADVTVSTDITDKTALITSAVAGTGTLLDLFEPTGGGTSKTTFTPVALSANRTVTMTDADVDLANVNTSATHTSGDGSDHADVATNSVHVAGDGSDHADVAANTVKTAIITMAVAGTGTTIDVAEPTGGGTSKVSLVGPALAADATVTLPNATVNLQTTVDAAALITPASASAAASLALAEDTDNGSNTVTIIAPASVASNKTLTLADTSIDMAAMIAENTDGQLFIPASEMVAVSGSWTLSEASDVAIQTRTAAAASHKVIFPVDLRGRTTASRGAKITGFELVYAITVEIADDVAPALIVTTLGGDTVAPTAAAAAITFATASDSAVKRGTVAEHTAVATVDTPAYIADNKGYHVSVTVDDTTGGNAVVAIKGLLVNFSEALVDIA